VSFRIDAGSTRRITLWVNGVETIADVESRTLLVDLIRDDLRLTGTHVGCRTGDCGACTVAVDGQTVKSCLELAARSRGRQVLTIEGLATVADPHPIQTAFDAGFAYQCGFCLPGMLLCGREAIEAGATSRAEFILALNGNLCRCTGYANMLDALVDLP